MRMGTRKRISSGCLFYGRLSALRNAFLLPGLSASAGQRFGLARLRPCRWRFGFRRLCARRIRGKIDLIFGDWQGKMDVRGTI